MRRNSAITLGLLVALAIGTAWCFSVMMGRRFAGGEVYPSCSTMRTDPLGAKVLYEAIDRLADTSCERNYRRLSKLSEAGSSGDTLIASSRRSQTLMMLDIESYDFENGESLDGDVLRDFAAAGGRVVLTVSGGRYMTDIVRKASEEREKELREERQKKRREKSAQAKEEAKKKESAEKDKDKENDSKTKSQEDEPKKGEVREHGPNEAPDDEIDSMPLKPVKSIIEALHIGVKTDSLQGVPEGGHTLETPEGIAPIGGNLPQWYSRITLDLSPEMPSESNAKKLDEKAAGKEDKEDEDSKMDDGYKQPWRVLATVDDKPVLAERRFGHGSVVVATDSYFAVNQALMMHPVPEFLAWLVGNAHHVIFDETHLGTEESPGIMTLARRYRLQGFFLGGVLLFLLFVWQSSSSLVPAQEGPDSGPRAVAGQGAVAGLVSLLRRGIPRSRLLQNCFDQWVRNHPHPSKALQARIEAARSLLPQEAKRPARGSLVRLYQRLCETIHPNRL